MRVSRSVFYSFLLLVSAIPIGLLFVPNLTMDNVLYDWFIDGFMSQLSYIIFDYDFRTEEALSVHHIHYLRWMVFVPNLHGGLHIYVLYVLYASFAVYYCLKYQLRLVAVVLLLMPFFLSARAGFSAVGLITIYFAMLGIGRKWGLFLGMILVSMSSSTILQAFLFIIYIWRKKGVKLADVIPCFVIFAMLVVVVLDKITGASQGLVGYVGEAAGADVNILLIYLSRSTIVYGLANGEPRAYVYLALGIFALLVLLRQLLRRGQISGMRKAILICVAPGFLMEGLGVVSSIPVVLWVFNRKFWDAYMPGEESARHDPR